MVQIKRLMMGLLTGVWVGLRVYKGKVKHSVLAAFAILGLKDEGRESWCQKQEKARIVELGLAQWEPPSWRHGDAHRGSGTK